MGLTIGTNEDYGIVSLLAFANNTNPTENYYNTITEMLSDQENQTSGFDQNVLDATLDPFITDGVAIYRKTSTSISALSDYIRLSDAQLQAISENAANRTFIVKFKGTSVAGSIPDTGSIVKYSPTTNKITNIYLGVEKRNYLQRYFDLISTHDIYITLVNKSEFKTHVAKISSLSAHETNQLDVLLDSSHIGIDEANISAGNSIEFFITATKIQSTGGSSGVSEQRTGNTLVFDNTTGAFYNSDAINGADINLSNTGAVNGGRTVIFSKSETTPTIISPNDLRQTGTYNTATDRTNVLTFEKMPNGDFLLNIWDYEASLVPPTDIDFLNARTHIKASDVTFDGSNVVLTIPDATANGNDFTPSSSPEYVANGINGLPSIRFDGTNYMGKTTAMGLTDVSERVVILVYQLEDTVSGAGTYQNIMINGASSYTSAGANFLQLQVANNSTANAVINATSSSLDTSLVQEQESKHFVIINKSSTNLQFNSDDINNITKVGTQNINDSGFFVGAWSGNTSKMLFSELIVLDNDTLLNTGSNLDSLKLYLRLKYNFIDVFNEGVPSDGTNHVLLRLETINAHNSENVALMIGTNDWSSTTGSTRNTPTQYKTQLKQIVQSLQANGSRVILMQIPPAVQGLGDNDTICSYYGEPTGCDVNATAQPFRDVVNEVSTEDSTDFIDVYTELLNAPNTLSTYYNADGRHFSPEGNNFVANLVKSYMDANGIDYNFKNTITCVGDSITFGFGVGTLSSYPNKLRTIL